MLGDSIRDILGFNARTLYEEFNLSSYPPDILSFHNIFHECVIAQGIIFRSKRSGSTYNFTMDVDTGYIYIEKFRGGVQPFMIESKDIISSISFKNKNENKKLVSINGQSITF